MRLLSNVLEKFLSRKLGAFLVSIFSAYFCIQHLDLERAEKFMEFLTWITGFYLGAQGGVDVVESVKKSVGLK